MHTSVLFGLVVWILWHINLSRLFNTKSIFMKIVLFQTIQFSISTEAEIFFFFKPSVGQLNTENKIKQVQL